jgi:hypothetical protein
METSKSIKPALDRIERPVTKYLKAKGFVKKGRNYNRPAEEGLVEVINFQSGTFPIGKYEIPGLRESKYGQFTINLGIAVPEIHRVTYPKFALPSFWKEYECQIRDRLGRLLYSKDYWWEITDDAETISKEIIDGLENKGIPWLDQYSTREKICLNYNSTIELRADLDVAIITFLKDPIKGTELFQEYYGREHLNKFHNEHVKEVAKRLGVDLA